MYFFVIFGLTLINFLSCQILEIKTTKSGADLIFIYDHITNALDFNTFIDRVKFTSEFVSKERKNLFRKTLVVYPTENEPVILELEMLGSEQKFYTNVNANLLRNQTLKSSPIKGLRTALEICSINSSIFLFTVAQPEIKNEIFRSLIEAKNVEITFALEAANFYEGVALEYYKMAFISGGFVFDSISRVFDFLPSYLLKLPKKINLLTAFDGRHRKYNFTVDPHIHSLTTIISNYQERTISNKTNQSTTLKPSEHYKGQHSLMENFYTNTSHSLRDYRVEIKSRPRKLANRFNKYPSFYQIQVFGESYFNFVYGFSNDIVSDLNETFSKPKIGTSSYIYISSSNTSYNPVFKSCEIITTTGDISSVITLSKSNDRDSLYIGAFGKPPKTYFHLRVVGTLDSSIMQRISNKPILAEQEVFTGGDEYFENISRTTPADRVNILYGSAFMLCVIIMVGIIFWELYRCVVTNLFVI